MAVGVESICGARRAGRLGRGAGVWRVPGQTLRRLLSRVAAIRSGQYEEGPADPVAAERENASTGTGGPGARGSFDNLFARYHLSLIEFLDGMTRDRDMAANLAQDTFLRAYSSTQTLAGIAHPQAWHYRIATNVALNAVRHRRHLEWLPLSPIEPEPGVTSSDRWPTPPLAQLPYEDIAATFAERDAVWGVLAELPPRWRAVLLLQTTAGFGVGEIATMLKLSEANVRKILFRAKERFRQRYAQLAATGGQA